MPEEMKKPEEMKPEEKAELMKTSVPATMGKASSEIVVEANERLDKAIAAVGEELPEEVNWRLDKDITAEDVYKAEAEAKAPNSKLRQKMLINKMKRQDERYRRGRVFGKGENPGRLKKFAAENKKTREEFDNDAYKKYRNEKIKNWARSQRYSVDRFKKANQEERARINYDFKTKKQKAEIDRQKAAEPINYDEYNITRDFDKAYVKKEKEREPFETLATRVQAWKEKRQAKKDPEFKEYNFEGTRRWVLKAADHELAKTDEANPLEKESKEHLRQILMGRSGGEGWRELDEATQKTIADMAEELTYETNALLNSRYKIVQLAYDVALGRITIEGNKIKLKGPEEVVVNGETRRSIGTQPANDLIKSYYEEGLTDHEKLMLGDLLSIMKERDLVETTKTKEGEPYVLNRSKVYASFDYLLQKKVETRINKMTAKLQGKEVDTASAEEEGGQVPNPLGKAVEKTGEVSRFSTENVILPKTVDDYLDGKEQAEDLSGKSREIPLAALDNQDVVTALETVTKFTLNQLRQALSGQPVVPENPDAEKVAIFLTETIEGILKNKAELIKAMEDPEHPFNTTELAANIRESENFEEAVKKLVIDGFIKKNIGKLELYASFGVATAENPEVTQEPKPNEQVPLAAETATEKVLTPRDLIEMNVDTLAEAMNDKQMDDNPELNQAIDYLKKMVKGENVPKPDDPEAKQVYGYAEGTALRMEREVVKLVNKKTAVINYASTFRGKPMEGEVRDLDGMELARIMSNKNLTWEQMKENPNLANQAFEELVARRIKNIFNKDLIEKIKLATPASQGGME